MLAHCTNGNILTIKKMLRHKQVFNTMKYIHTIQFKDENYEIATATTIEEGKQKGKPDSKFDEMNGIHFYRKPIGVYIKMRRLKVLMPENAECRVVGDDESGPEDE
jgi:hypothetical protein